MAHTFSKVNIGNNALAVVKVTDYVHGGEQFTLAEFALTGPLQSVFFITDPAQMTTPRHIGAGLVQLFAGPSQSIDLPTTTGLNFVFLAFIQAAN